MGSRLFSDRRATSGDDLARALLEAGEPLTFDELMAAGGGRPAGDVSAWLGNAMAEGLVQDVGSALGGEARFLLKARGRRVLAARRRAAERSET
jgi:hypothetical protein